MALGIVSDDEFERELNKSTTAKVVNINNQGRGESNNVPDALRKIIADESVNGTKANELANVFDISKSSISAYANGATSTASYHQPNESLQTHISKTKNRIVKRASRVLNKSLDAITDDDLKQLGAVKAAVVARQMSAIIKDMEPSDDAAETNIQQNVIYYAPRLRSEDEFESIQLTE